MSMAGRLNGDSEFCGVITSDEKSDCLSFRGGTVKGVMTIYTGGTCDYCEIFEADIMLNAAIKWTSDYRCQLARGIAGDICEDAVLYEKTVLHEVGHAFGLMLDGDWEDYEYDHPTVMNGGLEDTVENCSGLHVADTTLLYRWYADQRNDAQMNHEDIGVESWYAAAGAKNSTIDKTQYAPGELITLHNITIENIGRHDVSNVKLRAFLDTGDDLYMLLTNNILDLSKIPQDRLMPPAYYYVGTILHREYWVGDVTFQIPDSMPSGTYRVHLVVTPDDDNVLWEDATHHNNHTFIKYTIEVDCPKPAAPGNFRKISGDTGGVTLGWGAVANAQILRSKAAEKIRRYC